MNNQVEQKFTQAKADECLYQLKELSFNYQNKGDINNLTPALTKINLTIKAGEKWSVIGPSGCGKSTLLYLLAGLLEPTQGKIYYKNQLHYQVNPEIALILQDYGLFPWKTVYENVALGLELKKSKTKALNKSAIKNQVDTILKRFGIYEKAYKYPSQLSGGQKQRVAIARALILKPKVLLMDEPFAALDAITKESLKDFLLEICHQENLTLVFVTHNIEEAVEVGDKILIFSQSNGEISQIINNEVNSVLQEDYNKAFAIQCEKLKQGLGIIHPAQIKAGDANVY